MASEKTVELYRLLLSKGYPEELCREIAYKHMNTDYTATRMMGIYTGCPIPESRTWLMKCWRY